MKNIFPASIMAAIALVAFTLPGLAQTQLKGLTRTDLLQHDLSIKAQEVIQNRVEISRDAAPVRHKHPGVELVYVLEGSIEYQVEGKAPVTLKAGDVLFIPAGAIHSAKNVGSGTAVELATYIVEKASRCWWWPMEKSGSVAASTPLW